MVAVGVGEVRDVEREVEEEDIGIVVVAGTLEDAGIVVVMESVVVVVELSSSCLVVEVVVVSIFEVVGVVLFALSIADCTTSGEAYRIFTSLAFGVPQTKCWSQRLLQMPSSFPVFPEEAHSLRQS